MKSEKIVKIIKKFDEGDMSEKDAIKNLENAEPFDFYAATVELYLEDKYMFNEDDFPLISNLFKGLYKNDFSKIINKLEENHPIKRLMIEHTKFETLLEGLELILKEKRKEKINNTEKTVKLDIIAEGLKHLDEHIQKEERLIYPVWNQIEGLDSQVSFLLEEEHRDILKSHLKLLDKLSEKKLEWKKEDWEELLHLSNDLIEEVRFHTFHEGEIFYPVLVDECSDKKFDYIKKKIDGWESKKTPLDDYIKHLSLPILNKED